MVAVAALLALRTAADASCGEGERHLRAGRLAEAEKAFETARGNEPASECAEEGAAAVTARRCAAADAARSANLLTAASKAYGEVLAKDPGASCAYDGMWSVVARMCERAEWLKENVPGGAAKTAFEAVLAIEPHHMGRRCAARGLEEDKKAPPKVTPKKGTTVIIVRGANGRNGKNGRNGRNGKNGNNGKNGRNAGHRQWTG